HLFADFRLYLGFVLETADAVEELTRHLRQLAMLDGDDLQRQIQFFAAELFVFGFGWNRDFRIDRIADLLADDELIEAFELAVAEAERRLDFDRLFGELRELAAFVR